MTNTAAMEDERECSTGPLNGSFDLGDMDDASKLIKRIVNGENTLIEVTMLYAILRRKPPESATASVPRLRLALTLCAERFREYEKLHAAKPDPIKAARNAEMAEMCEQAIAAATPTPTPEK